MAKLLFDIMKGDRYYTTFTYHYTPELIISQTQVIESFDMNKVIQYALQRFPSIKKYKL